VELGGGRGSYPFARWEDIDRIIRPFLDQEGFALTFNSQIRTEAGGGLVVTGILMHRDGHSITAHMPLPLDTGPGRNNLQATGSTLSYGKRYVAEMLLNIVREGDDDDGVRGGLQPITDDQLADLAMRCKRLGVSLDSFCRTLAVETLADLDQSAYPIAINLLSARERRVSPSDDQSSAPDLAVAIEPAPRLGDTPARARRGRARQPPASFTLTPPGEVPPEYERLMSLMATCSSLRDLKLFADNNELDINRLSPHEQRDFWQSYHDRLERMPEQ
jgi:ERF superfamily